MSAGVFSERRPSDCTCFLFLGSDEEEIIQHPERLKQMDEGAIVTVPLAEKELQMIYITTSTMQEYGSRLACTVTVIPLWFKFLHSC